MMDKEIGREFLLLLGDLLDRAAVPFFLMQGTALGVVRDGGFVPTELDIDLGFLFESFRAVHLVALLTSAGIEVNTFDRFHGLECHTIVAKWRGVKADLVSWRRTGDGLRRYASAPDGVEPHYCIVHEAALIERWRQVEMFNRGWNVPDPAELYLIREYGPDWRTPREDHVSRTRVYNFVETEGIPKDYLEQFS